jgi:hypothetical protein
LKQKIDFIPKLKFRKQKKRNSYNYFVVLMSSSNKAGARSSTGVRTTAKAKKQTLQLIPSSSALKQRLRGLGANPFVQ